MCVNAGSTFTCVFRGTLRLVDLNQHWDPTKGGQGRRSGDDPLAQGGADLEATDGHHLGLRALLWAAFRGHVETIRALAEVGANVNEATDHWNHGYRP